MKRTSACLLLPFSLTLSLSASLSGETVAFDPARSYLVGNVPEVMALGDLNGDAILDLVVANTSADGGTGGNSVSVLLGTPSGAFSAGGLPIPVGERPEGLVLARIDLDSKLDLVTANFAGDSVSVLLGHGSGSFVPIAPVPVPGGPRYVVAADFNGDSITDLATCNYNDSTVSILKGNGDGTFVLSDPILVGEGPEVIGVGHFNDDSFLDLVTCDAIGNTVTLLQGDGSGGFSFASQHAVGQLPRFVLVTDLDADGLDDLVVANNSSNNIFVEHNHGAYNFINTATLSFSDDILAFHNPVFLAAADLNDDGLPDIIASWAGSNLVTVFPRAANLFEYDPPSAIQTGNTPVGILAEDYDGDGDVDLLVSNAADDTLSVYRSYLRDPGIIVDNDTLGTESRGAWPPSEAPFAFGTSSLFSKNGTEYVWETTLPVQGQYEVLLWWTVTPNRSTAVPVEIQHSAGSSSLLVNQRENIGVWHSLGVYTFRDEGRVVLTCPDGEHSVSADAVRFRRTGQPGTARGTVPVVLRDKPADISIGDRTVLAMHGSLAVRTAGEAESWVGAIVHAAGAGVESNRIEEVRLYIDSNHNGVYDLADNQLGSPLAFESDIRSLAFQGFEESIASGSSVDFFLVSKLLPGAVSSRERGQSPFSPLVAVAGACLGSFFLLGKNRRKMLPLSLAVLLLAGFSLLPLSGCGTGGGGGGGGGNDGGGAVAHDLTLELSSVITRGDDTGSPPVVIGLPLEGWAF
jgi:hypothetical protein